MPKSELQRSCHYRRQRHPPKEATERIQALEQEVENIEGKLAATHPCHTAVLRIVRR